MALFEKEHIALFLLKIAKKSERAIHSFCALSALFVKSKRAICSFTLFLKEQKSDLLFGALFKTAKERFALFRSFGIEQKSKSLFVAHF